MFQKMLARTEKHVHRQGNEFFSVNSSNLVKDVNNHSNDEN